MIYLNALFGMMGGQGGEGGGAGLMGFAPILLIFVIFYFLLIRPQQKKSRDHQDLLKNLNKGDEVVTNGGLMGRITALTDSVVTLEIAPKVRVKVSRSSVSGLAQKPGSSDGGEKAVKKGK